MRGSQSKWAMIGGENVDKEVLARLRGATYKRNVSSRAPSINYGQFALALRDLNRYMQRDGAFRPRKYTLKQVQQAVDNPETHQDVLRDISQYLYVSSGAFMRSVRFFADMLALDYVLIPDKPDFTEAAWRRAHRTMENYNIKHEFRKILTVVMREDVFYGIEISAGESQIVHQLPSNRCKISSIVDGVFNFSVDCSMYDTNLSALDQLPPSFMDMYNTYKSTGNRWQEVDDNIAVCFKFNVDMPLLNIPPLIGAFEDAYDLDEAKAIAYTADKMDNYRLIIQKIPMKKDAKNEKDFIFTQPTVETLHKNIANSLPANIGLISSPMDVSSITLDQSRGSDRDNVGRTEQNMWTSVGLGNILNSRNNNSISLNRNINAAEAMMFPLLRQIERFFLKRVRGFKAVFLDLTIYNRKEMLDVYLKLGQYGFPKSLIMAASGQTQQDMLNLLEFEARSNTVDKLVPLKSSHTATESAGGRPLKVDGELGEEGVKTREGNTNETRAQ